MLVQLCFGTLEHFSDRRHVKYLESTRVVVVDDVVEEVCRVRRRGARNRRGCFGGRSQTGRRADVIDSWFELWGGTHDSVFGFQVFQLFTQLPVLEEPLLVGSEVVPQCSPFVPLNQSQLLNLLLVLESLPLQISKVQVLFLQLFKVTFAT